MVQTTVKIDGMMCGMCEAHINDAIRDAFPVKKVVSSHTQGKLVVVSEKEIAEQDIRDVIDQTGYKVLSIVSEPYQKKGLFSRFRK